MNRLLIVDDVPINRELLKNIFAGKYELIEADDGAKAIELLKQYKDGISIVLLDLIMPEVDGFEVLSFMKKNKLLQRIPVIVITGEATTDNDIKSYEYGASDVIYKPYIPAIVVQRVKNLTELYAARRIAEDGMSKTAYHLSVTGTKLSNISQFLAVTLATVSEYKDEHSELHVKRVIAGTYVILKELNALYPMRYHFTEDDVQLIAGASALHDIGMVGIPDSILTKDTELEASEREILKKHPTIGCELLERLKIQDEEFFRYVYDICQMHHERIDGKGYPSGLTDQQIPVWAQVVGLVDAYTALREQRNWRAAFDEDTAIQMIKDGKCGAFAPYLIEVLEHSREYFNESMERAKQAL